MTYVYACEAHDVAAATDQIWEVHLFVDGHRDCGFVVNTTEGNAA